MVVSLGGDPPLPPPFFGVANGMSEHVFTQFLLGLLATAFFTWAGVLNKSTRRILERFDMLNKSVSDKFDSLRAEMRSTVDDMRKEMMEHMITTERRLVAMEAMFETIKGSSFVETERKL